MAQEYIEEINSKERTKRASTFDRWQKYLDQFELELQGDADPFDSPLAQKMLIMSHHVNSSEAKHASQNLRDFTKQVNVKNLTDSHKPGAKEIAPVTVQLICGLAAAVLGVVPVVGNFSQQTIGICNNIGNGASAVGSASQSATGIFSSQKQGEISSHNYELQVSNQQHDDVMQSRREAEEARKRQAEEAKQLENQKHQTKQSIMAN